MKVAVFGTTVSDSFTPVLNEFFGFLKTNNVEVQLYQPFYLYLVNELKTEPFYTSFFNSYHDFENSCDFIFSVGGDGTFLHSVLSIRNFDIPVIGVNSGRLGFLADISENQVQNALTQIFNHNYSVIERTMLQVDFSGKDNLDFNFALNEMTVLKTDTSSMINIYAYLGDELLNNYWADGLDNCYSNGLHSLLPKCWRTNINTRLGELCNYSACFAQLNCEASCCSR
jgi:NAD+ kinase